MQNSFGTYLKGLGLAPQNGRVHECWFPVGAILKMIIINPEQGLMNTKM